jgi:hypothetical protein
MFEYVFDTSPKCQCFDVVGDHVRIKSDLGMLSDVFFPDKRHFGSELTRVSITLEASMAPFWSLDASVLDFVGRIAVCVLRL